MKKFFGILLFSALVTCWVQNSYAGYYESGKEAFDSRRYAQAMEYFMAVSDDVESIYHIGMMYQFGLGVRNDYSKAFDWYEKGMELGGENSRIALARLYAVGLGVPPDTDYALKLLNEGDRDNIYNKIAVIAFLRLGFGPDNSKELEEAIISETAKDRKQLNSLNRQINHYIRRIRRNQS